jgi:hypothetical protein
MRRIDLMKLIAVAALFVAALVLTLSGCEGSGSVPSSPEPSTSSSITLPQQMALGKSDSRILAAIRVQEKHTQRLMSVANVVGTAIGLNDADEVVVKIYTAKKNVSNLPSTLDGMKVDVEVTGIIRAMGAPGGGGVSHTAKQTPPIQLGTSGSWRFDLANGYCCGGTLGSLVSKGGIQYVLSNYHVLEADIVNGGNNRVAHVGDFVIQPGLIDVNCNMANAQNVATLSGIKSLPGSNVDAAIAAVISGMVRTDGSILEVGTLSASTVSASINKAVKKSGRTTGLTRSTISGLNATVSVKYENECAGGTAFTKTFTGQIIIANKGSRFLNSGDSGSLMVEDVTTHPRAVGLLFAGSSSTAVANPIGEVLSYLGATMVGQ